MRKTWFLKTTCGTILVVLVATAFSQGASPLSGQIVEEFGGVRGQSAAGGMVVGVIQGPLEGRADLRALRALMPQRADTRSVCFRATTFDSVYSASGTLRARPDSVGASRIGAPPFPQRNDELRRYPDDELAVSLVLSANCDLLPEKPLMLVPATFGGPSNRVRVALNTRPPDRLEVLLISENAVTSLGRCKELDKRSAKSFHYVCDFTLEPPFDGGKARLSVTRKMPGVRESTTLFDVMVHDPRAPIVDRSR